MREFLVTRGGELFVPAGVAGTGSTGSRFGARGTDGGPQQSHIRHMRRAAPGVVIASVARMRVLVVVMRASKTEACANKPSLSE
ncbi:hypothetical protein GCM10018779_40320 [Streptomyces griseocarneus]|nr:hypothetical protein GCM10018779_40320 [Streptomyces griseocarneus]